MAVAGQQETRVHFRLPLWQPLTASAVIVFWLVEFASSQTTAHPPIALAIGYVLLLLADWALWYWSGLILTPTHAIVRGFRLRRTPWSDVRGVSTGTLFGADRIVLSLADGTTIRPRAPYCSLGIGARRFDRDYHRIGQWWQAHHAPAS